MQSTAKDVLIGIIDTGIDSNHVDLADNIYGSLHCDCTQGYVANVSTPTDPAGHGTNVAGVIAASGDNCLGITGVCWETNLISLRAFDEHGQGCVCNIALAINYAEANNIDVLNLSAVANGDSQQCLYTSISNFTGIIVCASGNDGDNVLTTSSYYPVVYSLPGLITVGASTTTDAKCNFSNYGIQTVDLFAPGENIYTCCPSSTYDYKSGTSLAAPYVTGAVALLMAEFPSYTTAQIKQAILNNVDTVYNVGNNVLGNLCVSGGRLNVYNVLLYH